MREDAAEQRQRQSPVAQGMVVGSRAQRATDSAADGRSTAQPLRAGGYSRPAASAERDARCACCPFRDETERSVLIAFRFSGGFSLLSPSTARTLHDTCSDPRSHSAGRCFGPAWSPRPDRPRKFHFHKKISRAAQRNHRNPNARPASGIRLRFHKTIRNSIKAIRALSDG